MERAPNNAEALKNRILEWFDASKSSIQKKFEFMNESDLKSLSDTLDRISSEYNDFNDFVPPLEK